MKSSDKKESLIKYKLLYTVLILLIYIIGRELPVYMVDVSAYADKTVEAGELLMQTISGDVYRCSIFALGISPLMISGVIVQIINAFKSNDEKSKISPRRMNNISLTLTLIMAILQAGIQVQDLQFTTTGHMLILTQIVASIEMVAGAMIIMLLASRNKRYGVGGQSVLVIVNVIDSLKAILADHSASQLVLPMIIAIVIMMITIIMENTEKRIPVQRISIHNIYADRNYLAIKLNPIGVMPAMFSTAFFMVPQLIVALLGYIWPDNETIIWWQDNLTLSNWLGIVVYVLVLYVLTIGFSRVFVNPKDITEQYLKSGDCLQDIHAGRDTRRYISGVITSISFLSATVMSVCLTIPMSLQTLGYMDMSLTTLPTMTMMLTGVWCNIYSEYRAIRDLEAYKPFI